MNRPTKFYFRGFTHSLDIRGTLKFLGVTWQGHVPFLGKKTIKGIYLAYHCEYAHQILYS